MTQQRVIFIISETDKGNKIKLEFAPPLADAQKFAKMNDARKRLQNAAAKLAAIVMDTLKQSI